MVTDFKTGNNKSPKARTALTTETKKKIRELVGKCEYCDRETSPDLLNVYPLSPLAQPEYPEGDFPGEYGYRPV